MDTRSRLIGEALRVARMEKGISLSEVEDVLGHACPLTTKQIYAHCQPQVLRAAVQRYSALPSDLIAELDQDGRLSDGPRRRWRPR